MCTYSYLGLLSFLLGWIAFEKRDAMYVCILSLRKTQELIGYV